MNYTLAVLDFMKKYQQPIGKYPRIPSQELCDFRCDLIQEELNELRAAIESKDIYLVADAIADLKYVIFGAEITFGITVGDSIFEIVHISNMTKDGGIIGHKVQKGPGFRPPAKAIKDMIDATIKMSKPQGE